MLNLSRWRIQSDREIKIVTAYLLNQQLLSRNFLGYHRSQLGEIMRIFHRFITFV
ncbi:hypothetical protein [Microcystis aeruginosa]|uniref:Uncharacterized protein n=1 Tax=Microcystis aeruginosa FD4 TaxID=2686288 RepID=A0A857D834_MICAE|nr:hypothetical protein [Microcystis aeruginosa]MDB9420597.1 hypothetical protein [Microcystis aeruginosa CS-563/04]NCR07527.1 hypothetical protein [Microcystis aeruginosa LG13-11]QGZ91320.1 hypothetical protein GQR42_19220 [Microcystis aeruginosa FD4]